jgi:hypothetical protein
LCTCARKKATEKRQRKGERKKKGKKENEEKKKRNRDKCEVTVHAEELEVWLHSFFKSAL